MYKVNKNNKKVNFTYTKNHKVNLISIKINNQTKKNHSLCKSKHKDLLLDLKIKPISQLC
jgi:hypothetical protein